MPTGAVPRFSLSQERAGVDLGELRHAFPSPPLSEEDDEDSDVEICEKALLSNDLTIRDDDEDDMSWASLLKLTMCIGG